MSLDLVTNVVVAGVLTGLVYGLMALGLSVIFGVVRVVNFAHGEMMTLAMYAAAALFGALKLDPFLSIVPVAAAFFAFGYAMQAVPDDALTSQPHESPVIPLTAHAIPLTDPPLLNFGPVARNLPVHNHAATVHLA